MNPGFWQGKRVFLTGHTGFKGGWLSAWLLSLGARVKGYSLPPESRPNLFDALGLSRRMDHSVGDVRDADALRRALRAFRPDAVFHLAAQSLVGRSWREPARTFEVNVQGTVNLLEACRAAAGLKAVVCVTTDKVYRNDGRRALRESDPLGAEDPYSASKACAELAAESYRRRCGLPLATARAGNAIGGGDWGEDRIIPDAVRAFLRGRPLRVRHPAALRPWQHVLEPLAGYLSLAQALWAGPSRYARAFNFGPRRAVPVGRLVREFAVHWPGARWEDAPRAGDEVEAARLALDSSLAAAALGWRPRLPFKKAVTWTADWYRGFSEGEDPWELTQSQISGYSS